MTHQIRAGATRGAVVSASDGSPQHDPVVPQVGTRYPTAIVICSKSTKTRETVPRPAQVIKPWANGWVSDSMELLGELVRRRETGAPEG